MGALGKPLQLIPGQVYAYRKRARTLGEPVTPVEVVRRGPPSSRKVRVKYVEGEFEGLEEWVPGARIIAQWQDAESLIRDEKALLNAGELSRESGQGPNREPVDCVFSALAGILGSEFVHLGWSSVDADLLVIEGFPDPAKVAGFDPNSLLREPGAFVDRFGDFRAPFSVALSVAKHLCENYGDAVASYTVREQREHVEKTLHAECDSDRDFWEKELHKLRAACVTVREWCGADLLEEFDENTLLRAEVERLQQMIRYLADWLRDAGHPVKAGLVMKELRKDQDPLQSSTKV